MENTWNKYIAEVDGVMNGGDIENEYIIESNDGRNALLGQPNE